MAVNAPGLAEPRSPALAILVLVSTVQPLALAMHVPAIADMQADLGTSATTIQLTLSLFLAASVVGQIVLGPLSDITGRRPVMLGGIAAFIGGSLLCAHAQSVELLLLGRTIQAVGACAGLSLSRAMIRDVHGARTSASMIGYVTMGLAVAPLMAPALGGIIHEAAGWRVIFDLTAAYGALVLGFAWLFLFETHHERSDASALSRFFGEAAKLLAMRDIWIFAGTLCLMSSAFFAFVAAGPFVASAVHGLDSSEYGLYFSACVAGYIAGNFCAGRLSARVGIKRMIVTGNVIALAGISLAAVLAGFVSNHPIFLFAPLFLMGLGNGFALPNAIAGAVSVKPELAGTSSGLSGAFQFGGGVVVSILIGLMLDAGVFAGTVWVMLVPMLAGAGLALLLSLAADETRLR